MEKKVETSNKRSSKKLIHPRRFVEQGRPTATRAPAHCLAWPATELHGEALDHTRRRTWGLSVPFLMHQDTAQQQARRLSPPVPVGDMSSTKGTSNVKTTQAPTSGTSRRAPTSGTSRVVRVCIPPVHANHLSLAYR